MDGGAWWATVQGVARNRTRLSNFTLTFHFHALEEETRDQIVNICWIIENVREFQKKKKVYLRFIDYTKAFDRVDHNKL